MTQSPDTSDNLIPPDLRVRYTDCVFIGAGGMGRIISAHDTRLDKRVAIKMLPRNSENALAVMRFQQEAKAVSKLNNSHIVQVLDFGYSESGEPYLVMEHVNGEDLDALLQRRGPLPLTEVLTIAIQVCTALEHAHNNGIVHRDLKPGNIMIDAHSNVRVLDFGLARIMCMDEMDWRLTRPGQPVGSISYMSPEQVKGEEADERSDIYSLGLVILKMVTAELPFEELSAIEIVTSRLEDAPPLVPIRDDAPELCKALRQVVSKALAVEMDQRYSSMSLLKDALSHVEVRAQSAEYTSSAKVDPTNRRTSQIVSLAVAAVIAICIATSTYILSNNPQDNHIKLTHKKKSHNVISEKERHDAERNYMLKTKFRIVGNPESGNWIADSSVTDEDLELLADIPAISQIYFEGNHNITRKGIESLAKLPIGRLTCRETEIGDDSIPVINTMKYLTYLDLYECRVTEKGLMKLKPNANLIHLNVKKMDSLTGVGLKYIVESFPNLDFLSITSTGVERESMNLIARLKKLQTLEIAAMELKDDDITWLPSLPVLRGLDISNNPITEKSLAVFEKIKLKSIFLDYCGYLSPQALHEFRATMHNTKVSPEEGKKRIDSDTMELFREQ